MQGQAVQFWPAFASRVQLVSLLAQAHADAARTWLNVRRARRAHASRRAHARTLRAFLGLRGRLERRGPFDGPGAADAAVAAGGTADEDVDDGPGGLEPEETREFLADAMAEMGRGAAGADLPAGDLDIDIPRGLGGFGKSVELVSLGCVRVATGVLDALADTVDRVALALPWGATALGLKPELPIHACRLGQALECAHAWNAATVPSLARERWLSERRQASFESEARCCTLCSTRVPCPEGAICGAAGVLRERRAAALSAFQFRGCSRAAAGVARSAQHALA